MARDEDDLEEKIAKYRSYLREIGDPVTTQRIQELIEELEDQLKGLKALSDRDHK